MPSPCQKPWREVRGEGPHARLWHPRAPDSYNFPLAETASSLGNPFGKGRGMAFVGNAGGDLDLMEVGTGAIMLFHVHHVHFRPSFLELHFN